MELYLKTNKQTNTPNKIKDFWDTGKERLKKLPG